MAENRGQPPILNILSSGQKGIKVCFPLKFGGKPLPTKLLFGKIKIITVYMVLFF